MTHKTASETSVPKSEAAVIESAATNSCFSGSFQIESLIKLLFGPSTTRCYIDKFTLKSLNSLKGLEEIKTNAARENDPEMLGTVLESTLWFKILYPRFILE